MTQRFFITCIALSAFVNVLGQRPKYCESEGASFRNDPVELASLLEGSNLRLEEVISRQFSTVEFFDNGRARWRNKDYNWGVLRDKISLVWTRDTIHSGEEDFLWTLALDFKQRSAVKSYAGTTENYRFISLSFRPSCAHCLKRFVEERINEWQKKDEFEKTSAFESRVSPANRNAKISEFQEEGIQQLREVARNHFIATTDQLELLPYDADNETFKVETKHFGSIIFNVSIDVARQFKNSFVKKRVVIHRFDYSPTQMIVGLASVEVDGTTYEYDRSAEYDYGLVEVNYDFDGLDLSSIEEAELESNSQGGNRRLNFKGKEEIKFERSPTKYSISSVAVIPKQVEDCSGNSHSADALASYAENNILAHYEVADRRHLQSILDEHKLQMSGLTFEETLLENGCIENAEAYLFVQSNCLMGAEMIEVRLVHCETATLIWSCTGTNSSIQEVLERINQELQVSK